MEKYKASNNNFEDNGEQTQDARNIESDKKLIESAKEIGKKVPIPQVKAAAHAIDKFDKLTGGAATNAIANGVNNMSKVNPTMNQIQNASNIINDTEVSNTLNQATSVKSGSSKLGTKNDNNFLSGNVMSKLKIAKSLNLTIPIVYNSSGYETIDTIKSLNRK